MKIPCEIIIDLLPLYHDDVCSYESKTLVKEHLAQCNNCKSALEMMDAALPLDLKEQNLKEAEAVQKLAKRWKKGMVKSLLKGILITVIVVAVLALVLYLFMDFQFVPRSY